MLKTNITIKTHLNLHNLHPNILDTLNQSNHAIWCSLCSEQIKIAIKTHLNLYYIHSDILYAQNQWKKLPWKPI